MLATNVVSFRPIKNRHLVLDGGLFVIDRNVLGEPIKLTGDDPRWLVNVANDIAIIALCEHNENLLERRGLPCQELIAI